VNHRSAAACRSPEPQAGAAPSRAILLDVAAFASDTLAASHTRKRNHRRLDTGTDEAARSCRVSCVNLPRTQGRDSPHLLHLKGLITKQIRKQKARSAERASDGWSV
jgi:hypothetical protein